MRVFLLTVVVVFMAATAGAGPLRGAAKAAGKVGKVAVTGTVAVGKAAGAGVVKAGKGLVWVGKKLY